MLIILSLLIFLSGPVMARGEDTTRQLRDIQVQRAQSIQDQRMKQQEESFDDYYQKDIEMHRALEAEKYLRELEEEE